MGNLVAVVGRTIRLAGEGEGIEALSYRTIADGVDVNSDTGCIEHGNQQAGQGRETAAPCLLCAY